MDTLILKLALTPALIGAASLAGRRWGPSVSGWLVGLPFTSAPIVFFLALAEGSTFARDAAIGTLAGTLSQAGFCLAYAWVAGRFTWRFSCVASTLVFLGATAALQALHAPLAILYPITALALVLALLLMPRHDAPEAGVRRLPAWDLPARMIIATAFVIALTAVAATLGPHLTGLLAPFPLYAAILTCFAHSQQGGGAAIGVLRGLLFGLFAFATFFAVLAALLERSGIALAFAGALVAALGVQGGSFWLLRRVLASR